FLGGFDRAVLEIDPGVARYRRAYVKRKPLVNSTFTSWCLGGLGLRRSGKREIFPSGEIALAPDYLNRRILGDSAFASQRREVRTKSSFHGQRSADLRRLQS